MKRFALSSFLLFLGWAQAVWAQPLIDWAHGTGSTGIDQGNAIAVDTFGNVLVAGDFNGSLDFDPGPGIHTLTTMGVDMLIAKYDPNGNLMWAHAIGGAGVDAGTGIAVDDSGNVFVGGHFEQTVDFDPGPSTFNFTALGGRTLCCLSWIPTAIFDGQNSSERATKNYVLISHWTATGIFTLRLLSQGQWIAIRGLQRSTLCRITVPPTLLS
ncbi:MAG: SBBP repeat-containing protein [Bacteroidetes bacterium]|nr:SBBP repeat-containing protein [Bacteroidota bacterium]